MPMETASHCLVIKCFLCHAYCGASDNRRWAVDAGKCLPFASNLFHKLDYCINDSEIFAWFAQLLPDCCSKSLSF